MYICQGKTESNGLCEIKVINGIAECQNISHKTENAEGTAYNNRLMAGRLYATDTGENFEKAYTEVYTTNTGFREPDVVIRTGTTEDADATQLAQLSGILGTTGYDTTENFKKSLQEEYNAVVKSVYENRGFYCRKI